MYNIKDISGKHCTLLIRKDDTFELGITSPQPAVDIIQCAKLQSPILEK